MNGYYQKFQHLSKKKNKKKKKKNFNFQIFLIISKKNQNYIYYESITCDTQIN